MAADGRRDGVRTSLQEPHVRLTVEMALLLIGADLTRRLELPWRVAGVVFAVLAVVQGVRALRALRRHRREHPDLLAFGPTGRLLVGMGVALASGLLLLQLVLLAFTPVVVAHERCLDRALTRTAEQRCDEQLQQDLQEQLQQLGGAAAQAPATG